MLLENENREIELFGLTGSIQLVVLCVAMGVSPVADDWLLTNWFVNELDMVDEGGGGAVVTGAGMSVSGTK